MIESILHKGPRLLWEKDDPSKLPAVQVDKIRRVLTALDMIETLEPLRRIPGYRLHPLTGDLKGFWAIAIMGNFRVIFRFENENVYDIDYIDYH